MLSDTTKDEASQESGTEEQSSSSTVSIDGKKGKVVSFFVPDDDPSVMTRLASPNHASTSSQSFQGIALEMLDDLQQTPKSSKRHILGKGAKRRRVDPLGELVTSDKKFEEIENEEKEKAVKIKEKEARKKEKEAKNKGKEAKKRRQETKKKDPDADRNKGDQNSETKKKRIQKKCDNYEEIDEGELLNEFESSSDESRPEHDEISLFPPKNDHDAYTYLHSVWEELNPPVEERDLQGKVFAVVYKDERNKAYLFVGRILNRFLEDANGPAKEFQIECLKKAEISTSTILEETPKHLHKDIALYPAYDIICGSLNANILAGPTGRGGSKWSITQYPKCSQTFDIVKKIRRREEYERLYPIV